MAPPSLEERLAEILLKHDPIGIYFPEHANEDEYTPEAKDIAVRLPDCASERQCLALIYDSFVRLFGASIAGEPERYAGVAADVWALRRSL
jgi:hypothetical protein